ncbi:MAG: Ig-like domain-containing protein, partial [Nevskiales bacterium]
AEGITLTATVKDSNNTVLSGIDVAFGSSSGALQVIRGTTDASGTALVILTTGGDPSNRNITVTATAAGPTTDSLVIPVTGTTLTLNGPSSLGLNSTGNYSATLRNAANEPISGASLTVISAQGNTITPASPVTTGPTGQADFTLTVGTMNDTLTVSGNGATAAQTIDVVNTILTFVSPVAGTDVPLSMMQSITVHLTDGGVVATDGTMINFATTRGTINATGTVAGGAGEAMVTFTAGTSPGSAVITASFSGVSATLALDVISTDPDSINVQAQPNVVNVNGQTTIQAVVRDPSSNPVASQTVTFTVSNGPGNVSPGVGVTNSQGVVTTTYTAPSQPTASNGVTVTATVQSDPGVTGSTTLTVGGQALHISIGTGITISDDGVARYNLPYSVLVNDSNGNPPAAGTNVNLQVLSLRFYEGFYVEGPGSRWVPVSDPNDDDNLEPKTGCDSEDVNFNGVLNPGEDTHIAGPYQNPPAPTLAPGNVASVPGTLALNTGGTADFFVNYNKAFCSWVQV